MNTLKYSKEKEEEISKTAARCILEKKAIVYPTDTIYGIGADAEDESCVSRVYAIKKRDCSKKISVLVSDFEMLKRYSRLSGWQESFIKKILPGPFSVILNARSLASNILGPENKVSFRITNFPLCQKISKNADKAITTTSANLSGMQAFSVEEIKKQIGSKIDLYIDMGTLKNDPSTIIDISSGKAKVIRGALPCI